MEGSVQLASMYYLVQISCFFYKTSYLNEEVNCTEPSPSEGFLVSVRVLTLRHSIIGDDVALFGLYETGQGTLTEAESSVHLTSLY